VRIGGWLSAGTVLVGAVWLAWSGRRRRGIALG
jgi:hypothetical protein